MQAVVDVLKNESLRFPGEPQKHIMNSTVFPTRPPARDFEGDFTIEYGDSWMALRASPGWGSTGRAGDVLRVSRTATATGGSLGARVARGSGAAGALRCRPPGRGGRWAPSARGAVRVRN